MSCFLRRASHCTVVVFIKYSYFTLRNKIKSLQDDLIHPWELDSSHVCLL
jgi:hypothetical protein